VASQELLMLNFQFGLQRALPPHECKIAVETFAETQDAYCIMYCPAARAPPRQPGRSLLLQATPPPRAARAWRGVPGLCSRAPSLS
jgi:hypothetical protein